MRDCETRQQDLKAYLDGELPPGRRIALRWHLMRCARCREEREAMMEISRSFKTGDSETLDPALRDRILSSVTYAAAEPEALPARRRRSSPLLFVWGAAAAGVLAGVFLRPLLLPQQPWSSRISAPAAPSALSKLNQENAGSTVLPSSQPAAGTRSSVAPSPAKPAVAAPSWSHQEKADTKAAESSKTAPGGAIQQEARPYTATPIPADQDSPSQKSKTAPQGRLQTNALDPLLNQSGQSQSSMSDGNDSRNAIGTINENGANSQRSAGASRRIEAQQTQAKKRAALKTQQNSRSKNNIINRNEHLQNSLPSHLRK